MDFSLSRALIKVGAVYLIYKIDFHKKIKAKFVVLLEDFCDVTDEVISVLTTSNVDYHYKLSTVLVNPTKESLFTEPTLIECDNYFEIRIATLMDPNKSKYIGNVGEEIIEQIYDAFTHVTNIPSEILVRVFP